MRFIDVWSILERKETTKINVHILGANTKKEENSCITLVGTELFNIITKINYEIVGLSKRRDRIAYDLYILEQIGQKENVTFGKLFSMWSKFSTPSQLLEVNFSESYKYPTFTFNKSQQLPAALKGIEVKKIYVNWRRQLIVRLDSGEKGK